MQFDFLGCLEETTLNNSMKRLFKHSLLTFGVPLNLVLMDLQAWHMNKSLQYYFVASFDDHTALSA